MVKAVFTGLEADFDGLTGCLTLGQNGLTQIRILSRLRNFVKLRNIVNTTPSRTIRTIRHTLTTVTIRICNIEQRIGEVSKISKIGIIGPCAQARITCQHTPLKDCSIIPHYLRGVW